MVKTEKEALVYFAGSLVRNMVDTDYSICCLHIKRQEGRTGFSAMFYDMNGVKKSISIDNGSELCDVICDLYTITQTQPPIHKDWNKAVFTLYPNGKVDMEYIWDAEWQAELDKLRADFERKRNRRKK